MQFHGEAKCSSIEAFTAFILNMTVLALGVSMVPMSAKVGLRVDTTPCGGLRKRVVGRLDIGGGQRRSVVEPHALVEREGIGQQVGRNRPRLGEVAFDFRKFREIKAQQC